MDITTKAATVRSAFDQVADDLRSEGKHLTANQTLMAITGAENTTLAKLYDLLKGEK